MKPDHATLFLLASFAAAVLSEELRPHDVPFACANICGPIVELTSLCRVNTPASEELRRLKRRRLVGDGLRGPNSTKRQGRNRRREAEEALPNHKRQVHVGFDGGNTGGVVVGENGNGNVIGEFKTIPFTATTDPAAGAPGGFRTIPPDNTNQQQHQTHPTTPTTRLDLRPTTTPTVINLIIESPSSSPSPSLSRTSALTTASTAIISTPAYNLPVGDGGPATGVGIGDVINVDNGIGGDTDDDDEEEEEAAEDTVDEADGPLPDQGAQREAEGLETACTCSNDSFDVARVIALCADCIEQMNDPDGPMSTIMRQCNFTPEEYIPAKDSVAANVRVQAARPLLPGQSAASRPITAVGCWAGAIVTVVTVATIVM
ncbi:hypothetical protein SODALDRAFT_4426 [Sodiomyces alkalinus F11]|uniref:Extracellular membrane protein CFEM domain-containing protein n=1 Tax=Sodiomyces alkalinus (strain CBS 110278 / VKM F-3762 / F11) TaxID=1314773 RepID=A0A3N2Q5E1_SODAK|nr:hypothetical protein SODALDRAFT_4426 [Sodiomyces alkalinus F11]ROT41972.1 hypothetical protein SODALDRAFT_4426 [Sodiomyces alkalinus F11]